MATVRMSFTPAPAHVRTARLVGVAVARRAGVSDAVLDEVRLAVGEACSRAVALHRRHALTDLIEVEMTDSDQFTVRVTDRAPVDALLGAGLPIPAALLGEPVDAQSQADADPDTTDPFGLLIEGYDAGAQTVAEEDVAVGVALTLLASLVHDLSVRPGPDGIGTEVRMGWSTNTSR